jgi:hypothetical protein
VASVSSSTPLAANAGWASPWQVRLPYHRELQGAVQSDVGGTVFIEQAILQDADGNFIPDISAEYAVTGGVGEGIEETLKCRRWRLRYLNGPGKQTDFRASLSATPTEPPR